MSTENWARNIGFGAAQVALPESVDEVQELVASNPVVRTVGAAHSFNDICSTSGVLLDLARIDQVIHIDPQARTVTAGGGIRYHQLCQALHDAGWALHNLMSIPHFSVAGACSTATHGSGDDNGGLATAVREIELVNGTGELVSWDRSDPEFAGAVISLGALGAITRLTLDIQPTFDMAQELLLDLPVSAAIDDLDEIMASAYSVSYFTDWQGDTVNQLWRKHRLDWPSTPATSAAYKEAAPATVELLPNDEPGEGMVTPQLMRPGPWHQRLPHVHPSFSLPTGGELQSEYFVRREHGREALAALASPSSAALFGPVIRRAEIRTVLGDDAWLSPFRGDTLALHFSWDIDAGPQLVEVLPALEDLLAPFDALPHWGKLHTMSPAVVRAGYPRFDDFAALVARQDPERRFRNSYLDQLLG